MGDPYGFPPNPLIHAWPARVASSFVPQSCPVQAAIFRIAPGGRIARHPASCPQILAVLDGSGEVSGAAGVAEPIAAGEAVFWVEGEDHETTSERGLTALVIEGVGLEPFRR